MSRSSNLAVVDATPNFDAARATTAYLARVSGAARARSDAYFEGGYWLMLVDLLWTLAVRGCCSWLGISAAIARLGGGEHPQPHLAGDHFMAVAYVAHHGGRAISRSPCMKVISANMPTACRTRISWRGWAITAPGWR